MEAKVKCMVLFATFVLKHGRTLRVPQCRRGSRILRHKSRACVADGIPSRKSCAAKSTITPSNRPCTVGGTMIAQALSGTCPQKLLRQHNAICTSISHLKLQMRIGSKSWYCQTERISGSSAVQKMRSTAARATDLKYCARNVARLSVASAFRECL